MSQKQLQVASPACLGLDRSTGSLAGAARHYEKRLSELEDLYLDREAFVALCAGSRDQIAYWVDDFQADGTGSLVVGTSVLLPGLVGDEYAMTRGHIHEVSETAEVYHCVAGHGVLLMETIEGDLRTVEMSEDTIAYVPGHWIHRSVNVGSTPLVTVFTYDASAGQDYTVVERSHGLSQLVVRNGDSWTLRENPRYTPRDHER